MSPSFGNTYGTNMFCVSYSQLFYYGTSVENGIRPVINLRSDVKITGSGTIEDPYIVQTD